MSVAEAFFALTRGRRPANDALLGNCRLEWAGGEAYGEEAILQSFRADSLDFSRGAFVENARACAWLGGEAALFADLYEGRIGRLWRTGQGNAPAVEPAIGVAFDPDLRQQRGNVLFEAADHPDLDAEAFELVSAAVNGLVEGDLAAGAFRSRAFVLRAFTAQGTTAALCALHRLGGDAVRSSGFGHAVLAIRGGKADAIVLDPVRSREWTPRL